MSKLFGSARHFLGLADEKQLNQGSFDNLVSSGLLADIFDAATIDGLLQNVNRGAFREFLGLDPLTLEIVVDYSISLKKMISLGKYDWVNENITKKNFPLEGENTHVSVVELIHFNKVISSDEAERELKKMKLRPATIAELLAFGAKYPETQREFPIIALGSVASVDGARKVACLGRDDSGRDLNLPWRDCGWDAQSRFLAVRNY